MLMASCFDRELVIMGSPIGTGALEIQLVTLVVVLMDGAKCQRMGPYSLNIGSVENCGPKAGEGLVFESHIKKFNRTVFIIDATLNFTIDYDDSMTLEVDLAQFTNNGWKENYFKQSFRKACSTTQRFGGDLFTSMLEATHIKPTCPIPKGNYTMTKVPLALDFKAVPKFYYNKYRWRGVVEKNGRVVGCLQSIVDVVPRRPHTT